MIKIVKADGKAERDFLAQLRQRSGDTDKKVTEIVSAILDDVRSEGDEAVKKYTARFDTSTPEFYEVPRDVIDNAEKECDSELIAAMKRAAENIKDFHNRQVQQSWLTAKDNGVILGQRIRGLHRVGVYVPGGTAALFSSVLMNVIPAKIAGVGEIIMATPPCKDGSANRDILAAAAIAGVDRVFLCGGAQAIGSFAYGTAEIPKVDKIVGPGNIFVATAKRLVYGTVDIDMIAGPSEILIVADETADPKFLAADLMSQAEHDRLASAILVTTCGELAQKTDAELVRQCAQMSRREIIEESIANYGGPNIWKSAWRIPWNTSDALTTRVRSFLAITRRNRWAITSRVRIMCFPQAAQRDFSPRCRWTRSSRSPALSIIMKTRCARSGTMSC